MSFPATRLRRLRQHPGLRELMHETELSARHLVWPCFATPGHNLKRPIRALPGHFHWSPDRLAREAVAVQRAGIGALLVFGLPHHKDARASDAYAPDGAVQEAVRLIKRRAPQLVVITDVCVCGYMSHGHCGVLRRHGQPAAGSRQQSSIVNRQSSMHIDNDATLELLARVAISHAEAGADLVAPSDMMDGRVRAIRVALDARGFTGVGILSYAAKYASSFYGPFREAAGSSPAFGNRSAYQMDARNAREALREVSLDLEEGADIVMVKPALPYLDVIAQIKATFPVPLAAFHVSGEYAMIEAAAARGWLDKSAAALESVTAIKRAGADLIITYFARELATKLSRG